MRFTPTIAFVLPLAVAACGQPQPQASQQRQPIVVRSQAQNQLHQLDDMGRDIALKRAIHASGYRCKRVTGSGYVAEYRNLSMWTASCDDGREWAIFAGPDGSAQVRDCVDVKKYGLPACVIKEAEKAG